MDESEGMPHPLQQSREHMERRSRRKRRRTMIRSIYLVPSMATLGNAVCGFASIYIASLSLLSTQDARDPWTAFFISHSIPIAAYLIFLAMVFDALDGRLARFTRHTTDFGGQLDSMADVISFGVAPAILMLYATRALAPWVASLYGVEMPFIFTRAIWAIGAVYACCAAVRLARFNVSNEHGEQHHFSFLGLPSPAAGGAVAAWVLMCTALFEAYRDRYEVGDIGRMLTFLTYTHFFALALLPLITLAVGLLMVSSLRYPHIVNRYVRGRKSIGTLVVILIIGGVVLALHRYAIALATLIYVLWGVTGYFMALYRKPAAKPK